MLKAIDGAKALRIIAKIAGRVFMPGGGCVCAYINSHSFIDASALPASSNSH